MRDGKSVDSWEVSINHCSTAVDGRCVPFFGCFLILDTVLSSRSFSPRSMRIRSHSAPNFHDGHPSKPSNWDTSCPFPLALRRPRRLHCQRRAPWWLVSDLCPDPEIFEGNNSRESVSQNSYGCLWAYASLCLIFSDFLCIKRTCLEVGPTEPLTCRMGLLRMGCSFSAGKPRKWHMREIEFEQTI